MSSSSSLPKTLLELAGADRTPHALSESVLLIIDAQEEYVSGRVVLPDVKPALSQCANLVERARRLKVPVVHIVHEGGKGAPFDPESKFFQEAKQIAATSTEPVIRKQFVSGFVNTTLLDKLKELKAKNLIVCGFMSHMCVSTTVRHATDLGFSCTVVAGACCTRPLVNVCSDSKKPEVVSAKQLHEVAMTELSDRFARIASTADDIKDSRENEKKQSS
eukprot:TRINITY_DN133_c0_g1_i1.p1 TRINITY_DN133_c0_g1~~TRINITY_DN133_c0_g1_i1.p1  ORF type:complete len:219 (+),score=57.44 TRINITY_DN133_c0_g1_i1:51-707(+)